MTDALPEHYSSDGSSSEVETRIVRNAAALMASQLTTWALALVLAVVLPRYLGPRAVGQLQLATTVWTIVFSVVAFGSEMMLTKEIARRPRQAAHLLCTVIFLRLIFFVGGCIAVSLYIGAVTADSVQVSLFVILGMAQPLLLTAIDCIL
jgi:O-antigen/teichoic acid export membrane protein